MMRFVVVDANQERRAVVVDLLCELPGIEVRGSASDTSTALGLVDTLHVDGIVASNDLPGASVVTLIDCARRRGLTEVIVLVTARPMLPGMDDYWRDLGAWLVVDTLPELVERVSEIGARRERDEQRRRAVAVQLDVAAARDRPQVLRTNATAAVGEVIEHRSPRPRAAHAVAPDAVLQPVVTRLGDVVPPEVEFHLHVGPDAPRVRCTAEDVQQLAVLLVRDACLALPLGGKVWLVVEREGTRHVAIEVLDSSGRPRVPGRDLDVVRAIATRHNGEVRVVDLGGATSVQVVLPAALQPPN